MKGGDRSEAAAPDERDAPALRLDPGPRLAVVGACNEVLFAGAHLQSERTLPCLGEHHLRIEPEPDLRHRAPNGLDHMRRA